MNAPACSSAEADESRVGIGTTESLDTQAVINKEMESVTTAIVFMLQIVHRPPISKHLCLLGTSLSWTLIQWLDIVLL